MADFRQLALDFVVEDDETRLTEIAQKTARVFQTAPANTQPVARWVEAVQPWMPGGSDDPTDTQETPDWTSRAKALEFLSRTLDFLSQDILKPSQIKLLVTFFSAMFDIDHKAGIMASATALSRIVAMKSFQPQSGYDIIQKVCALKDDFPRQTVKTRLEVYKLLRSLITDDAVVADLKLRDATNAGYMISLLDLCQSERDPDSLMVWFDILKEFLQRYGPSASEEIIDQVFNAFKAYYPITLPRMSQSGITPEELKQQLRKCFSSTDSLAKNAFPFLIGKLDQGDGVTVNVKVDVLKTIRACIEEYDDASISPYIERIWRCLKYEVRNGEVEDTMWATLEVLKTLATKLKGDQLSRYIFDIVNDCSSDLSNPTYAAPVGRILISVSSASLDAFTTMAPPIIVQITDCIRRQSSSTHAQELLRILLALFETRILFASKDMSEEEKRALATSNTSFGDLDVVIFKPMLDLANKTGATDEEAKLATEAVKAVGALVPQPVVIPHQNRRPEEQNGTLLLSASSCSDICQKLFTVVLNSFTGEEKLDDLVNESTRALRRAVLAYPAGFEPLVQQAATHIRDARLPLHADQSAETIQKIGPLLSYVGCSELSQNLADGLQHFVSLVSLLAKELVAVIDLRTDPKVWCALIASIQSAIRYFNDAILKNDLEKDPAFDDGSWLRIVAKYPILRSIDESSDNNDPSPIAELTISELRNDFLLITWFMIRIFYRRAVATVDAHPRTGKSALRLSDAFTGANKSSESQYLHLLSGLASFNVQQMSESQQSSLQINEKFVNLFQDEAASIPTEVSEEKITSSLEQIIVENGSSWSWLVEERVNVLALGFLETLRPSGVASLFGGGLAQEILVNGTLGLHNTEDSVTRPVARSILTILANKYKIETSVPLMTVLNQQLAKSLESARASSDTQQLSRHLEQISSVYAITSGFLRRYSGKQAEGLLQTLREAPNDTAIGHHLARRLEMIVAPQPVLTKENFATVRPLWMQRAYMELVKPMIPNAVGAENQDPLVKTNFSIGVLLMVKHLPFSVYEEDSNQILRIAISVAQSLGIGSETLAALGVVKSILADSADTAKDHLRSLVNICISCVSRRNSSKVQKPDWMPKDYLPTIAHPDVEAGCGRLSLEIIAALPSMFESRHVLSFSPLVRKELALACGHPVRELRRIARTGRAAWEEEK
ncbi:DNA repair/transcription mms19-like protein [Cladobotryum mycophilum]|uniref:MMS19 nucleotide excision repair protein n=1 Tax=Cladobotryum mycophilum TaxID=491253 RepID=A0ABR0S9W6_9HYPO